VWVCLEHGGVTHAAYGDVNFWNTHDGGIVWCHDANNDTGILERKGQHDESMVTCMACLVLMPSQVSELPWYGRFR
jgi:hypothetical protein